MTVDQALTVHPAAAGLPEATDRAAAPAHPVAAGRPVLQVSGLRRAFAGVQAVAGVDLEVAPGEVVAIIGPNGSGKSTTLNLIGGLLRPDAGSVAVAGARIDGRPPEYAAAQGIARTFQNGRVFGSLTVAQNVEVGLYLGGHALRPFRRLAGIPVLTWVPLLAELLVAVLPTPAARRETRAIRPAVDAELSRFADRLAPRRDSPAATLSYANRRRTEIARALAATPVLLLLDEPTAGMNQTETAEVLDQLLQLKAAGQAMLLVEHKLDLVTAVSDRVIVMDEGRIIAEGRPEDVRADPAVIAAYLGRRPGVIA
jgi:branched-chain amino acid transport system ATP-binding protein